ncbi:hypothetical protein H9L01_03605 [Erysipelothrix inopinata]|uniref:Uncharacterized protein n=1 Tax=Erysipelothrix inopinata TaxID=225084 RepID=A0A7G9S0T5_9FIRM|nr:hypothetical protein [Erysipelothrix inopinata]QNN61460.1 hypothetical protein H9L01_03605 [Erysipelothrix inopinata]
MDEYTDLNIDKKPKETLLSEINSYKKEIENNKILLEKPNKYSEDEF